LKKGLCLDQISEILKYARLFEGDDLRGFISILNSSQNHNCHMQVLLNSATQLILKLRSSVSESNIQIKEIVNMLSKNVSMLVESSGCKSFLKQVIKHLAKDFNLGLRFESSELDILRNVLEMSIRLGLLEPLSEASASLLKKLDRIPSVLKWYAPLKLDLIKCELNRRESCYDELAADILCLERLKGRDLSKRLIELIKNVEIDDLLLWFFFILFLLFLLFFS
jgi:hypothetical protein